MFEPVLAPYEERFECILYDHPGAGRSRTPLRPISIPELAADAVKVLDELGLDSAHVMGVSMGGMVAQEMAIRFPHRVRGLVLGCTTPGGPRAVRPALGELGSVALGALSALRDEGRPWLASALFSERFRREHPERVRELLGYFFRHRARPHGVAWHWWASVYHDTVSRLHRIQAPTLVFQGGDDRLSPVANSQLLATRIPDAELAVVSGAGHAYALERPEESFELFRKWYELRSPIEPGRRPGGVAARAEPLTRAFGLQVGALRTGRSLVARAADKVSVPGRR